MIGEIEAAFATSDYILSSIGYIVTSTWTSDSYYYKYTNIEFASCNKQSLGDVHTDKAPPYHQVVTCTIVGMC